MATGHGNRRRLSYGQKVFLLATLPLVLAMAILSVLVTREARQMSEREIAMLEAQLIATKQAELRNYLSIARTAFGPIYGNALPDDKIAKTRVAQILAAMTYGTDGFFFVYDYDGRNIVSPRQTWLIEQNWAGLRDTEGTPVVDRLIELARQGAGYHSYVWSKPSTKREGRMITYVIGLQDWRWAIGTGVFIDDVLTSVAAARAETRARVTRTFLYIGAITVASVFVVFLSGLFLNLRERRLADQKLKALTQRIFDTQEEERGRVARELHDSISQILVGVRYTLELARRRLTTGDARAGESLGQGIENLNGAIQEVRRISRDLRPGVLDDLGLGPALQSLAEEFGRRTGITVDYATNPFRNRLDPDAKIALYRIAQEALTNIERHSGATHVKMLVRGTKDGAVVRIEDNGNGMPQNRRDGLGLRNMAERMERLDGTLRILSTRTGTLIEAQVPLSHMLPPTGTAEAQG
ncbi:MAG: cache domain-containing protein [Pseudotabrizicola sp.]|uniref:cache domain-containing protein n=1 Tax=Pseudotabrizicola sp. TaxID=2939647 RepID=UPI00271EC8CE|nr:cache domain-containing protein [Pseudotabrizicola sp.]MDO8884767.1 cache domain-containing protein [Pseudotabrizicola sp.]MDP2080319.1 cache domain-containing protein [Pseudotabrizicola sp.]MDZ7572358.1 cache domain-containing protein [Pseudotabrizicola sp.]